MKNPYVFYIKIIKPIENKYTRYCILHSIFKINYFKRKKQFYNKILIEYYRMLQNDYKNIKELEKRISK